MDLKIKLIYRTALNPNRLALLDCNIESEYSRVNHYRLTHPKYVNEAQEQNDTFYFIKKYKKF